MFRFPKHIIFLCLKNDFILTNNADPDEMPHFTVISP